MRRQCIIIASMMKSRKSIGSRLPSGSCIIVGLEDTNDVLSFAPGAPIFLPRSRMVRVVRFLIIAFVFAGVCVAAFALGRA